MATEWVYGVVDVADDSTTVFTGPALVKAVYVNTILSAHVLPIQDDTVAVFTLPASAAAGNFYDFYGTRFETSLVVNPDDAATGNVTVIYKSLR